VLTLVDYGIGNLRSLEKAFAHVGVAVHRTDDPAAIARATQLVVPGVGAFGACIDALQRRGLVEPILHAAAREVPLLGVCVGMQLLFDASEEHGEHAGLGLIPGRIVRFADDRVHDEPGLDGVAVARRLKVPHMGWSPVRPADTKNALGIVDGDHFYFVHSYYARPEASSDVLAWADYGAAFPAAVARGRVFGVQFHPEKSQAAGLRLLRAFADLPA